MTTYTAKNPAQLRAKSGTPAEILAGELALIDAKFDEFDASSVLGDLADGKIIVGNGDGVAADVDLSGDATIINTGAITIAAEAVTVAKMADLARGSIISGQTANNRPTALDAKTSGKILVGDGDDLVSVAVSGDVTLAANGAVTIAAGAVEESMLAVQTGDGLHAKRIARATYDVAELGGAISSIGLGVTLPINAIPIRTFYEVITTFTDGDADNATIAIGVPVDDVAGFVAATAITGGTVWDDGYHDGIQVPASTGFGVKLTAAREITVDVAVAPLTAGKMVIWVEYVVSDNEA